MAQTDATKTSDFSGFLKPEMAQPIFDEAQKTSVVQQLARQIPIGINGVEIPITTSKPTASWVAEGEQKPTTETALGLKTIKSHKIAAITVVSAEVMRANPGNYIELCKKQIGEAFALAFDAAVLHGTATPFDTHLGQAEKTVTVGTSENGLYGDLVSGLDLLVKKKKKLTGFVFDQTVEPMFLGQLDANKRPIFVPDASTTGQVAPVAVGTLLGRPARLAENVADETSKVLGFAGDWSKCVWGVTSGLSYRVSTEGTVTVGGQLVSLFERNLIAILAEAEYGFLCADPAAFVKFKGAAA